MKRDQMIQQLEDAGSKPWDVVVVGGGATGLGAALDAATRGVRVLLLEKKDFASGTSSRSTKLIHGGVRYLRQGNLKLVRESLRERGLLMGNAPGLVHPLEFIVPSCRKWDSLYYGAGLKVYDLLAGGLNLGSSRHLTKGELLDAMPGIDAEGIRGGTLYFDAQFDDARLAVALARTAANNGAVVINYMNVVDLWKKPDGGLTTVIVRDEEVSLEHEVKAKVVINAAGPYVDAVLRLDDPSAGRMITPSRGAHLVIDGTRLPGSKALMIPKTDDGRVLFLIPWNGSLLLGTTDIPCHEVVSDPSPSSEEVSYLLEHAGRYLERPPCVEDVKSMFAGLRPLVSSEQGKGTLATSVISRDHVIRTSPGGVVTVTGGKWTTYRKMAEDAVNVALEVAGVGDRKCRTEEVALDSGTPLTGSDEPLHSGLPYAVGDLERGIQEEMARKVEDLLARRTRCLFLDARASHAIAPVAARMLGEALGKGPNWVASEVSAFRELASDYLPVGSLDQNSQGTRGK